MDSQYDLLLQGGHVIDPANKVDAIMDVAIVDGRIAAVGPNLPSANAKTVMDAKGCVVTPGIIDMHTHLYPMLPKGPHSLSAIDCDVHLLRAGVTTAVDAGTTGWRDFLFFKEHIIDTSTVRVLAFLNIASGGMIDMRTEQNPKEMQPKVAAAVAQAYPDTIVGIKCAHYWGGGKPFDEVHYPWASVDRAVEAGALAGLPAMIDFQPNRPQSPYADMILEHLRPGDIHTHVFAQQFPIVDENGKVYDHMWKARENGVLFDVGHGGASFWFRNAKRALDDGFAPDTISTDIHFSSLLYAGLDNLQMMSKYLNMGMSLQDVVARVTAAPAKAINRGDLGTLSVGATADVAVLRVLQGEFNYVDCGKAIIRGDRKLECQTTICGGKVAYNAGGLGLPEWQNAPEAYWTCPYMG